MTVTLTPEMEEIVKKQLATGQFANQEEVVRASLQLLEQQYAELKASIAKSVEQARNGEVAPLDVNATLARVRAAKAARAGGSPCEG
jgi:putative addiction module CopG family antidote